MAKFVMTFENNEIKKELFFKGNTFSYSMIETDTGKESDAKCFDAQVEEKLGDQDDDILEALSDLDCGDEDDIEKAVNLLSEYEQS